MVFDKRDMIRQTRHIRNMSCNYKADMWLCPGGDSEKDEFVDEVLYCTIVFPSTVGRIPEWV